MPSLDTREIAVRRQEVARAYRTHARDVYRVCLRFAAGDRQWAEDRTHDVFLRLLEKHDDLDLSADLGPWLRTVAYRCCIDRLRHERSVWGRVRARLLERRPKAHVSPGGDQLGVTLREALTQIQRFPALERAVILMHSLDDLDQVEIAEALELSKGYVSKLLSRARARLRAEGWE